MPRQRLIVLKFGGSVLGSEDSLIDAVGEVRRWRRDGWWVIAVVSALAGDTDALLGRCDRLHGGAAPSARAAVVANGEAHSAALLGLLLDRAGIPAAVGSPGGLGLVAKGDPLDATPTRLDTWKVRALLDRHGVLVVPGFVAIDALGSPVVLGRGGSDLTALFLAQRCDADRCRLVKDVDGLYTSDPARPDPPPRRYRCATWADALATDGSIIQHKAVRFAQSHNHPFELCTIDGVEPTLIGAQETAFEPDVRNRDRPPSPNVHRSIGHPKSARGPIPA